MDIKSFKNRIKINQKLVFDSLNNVDLQKILK